QPGSRIAKSWNRYFGNRLIKYEEVQELKKFVLDGMEEELVLKVMEYSGLRADNPFHYTRAILLDLYRRGVLTLEDYNKAKGKGEADGQHFSEDDRRKEARAEQKHARFKAEEYR
ncbi:MAG: DnaD domain protein, partial [Bacillota bacterium]|nr:DnaD domain protein [Bacillota bacterium]